MNNTNTDKCPQLKPPPALLSRELLQYGPSTSGHSAVNITEKCKYLGCPPSACQHGSSSALKVCTVIRGNIVQLPTPQRLWARWIPRKRDECGCYATPCLRKAKFPTTLTCCLSDAFPACTTTGMNTIFVLRFQLLRRRVNWYVKSNVSEKFDASIFRVVQKE